MQRITLEKDFGRRIRLQLGYDPAPIDPSASQEVQFRVRPGESQAVARVWELDWSDPEMRSVLCPNEVAVHYFGDPRAGTDPIAERDLRIPTFNNERTRVAQKWGDYGYSWRGKYNTNKISVPDVPHVVIHNVNANGATVGETQFRPWEYWKFADLLAADASEQVAELKLRRSSKTKLNIADIPEETLDELAALLARRKSKVPA